MSLDMRDIDQIRQVVREVVREEVDRLLSRKLQVLENEIRALRNDIKDIPRR